MPILPEDPVILFSYLNTKLRSDYSSLAALCEDLQANEQDLKEKLQRLGYVYDKQKNQFI